MANQCKRWVFTLNNPTDDEVTHLTSNVETFEYLVFGREQGESGTPHLQGFFILKTKLRLRQVKLLISQRAHFEVCRGTPQQAAEYCKKDGDFEEFGQLSSSQGKRSDWERLKDWIVTLETYPSTRDLWERHPSLMGRYSDGVYRMLEALGPKPLLVDGELRDWQRELYGQLDGEPDDRKVIFVVDPLGGMGKSWFVRYLISKKPDDVQRLSSGKRDDLAHAINPEKRIFVFDIPRTQLEYMQYSVLEQLKDQLVFSPKYDSRNKMLHHKCHVMVLCNEEPDLSKMTHDRYNIIRPPHPDPNHDIYNV